MNQTEADHLLQSLARTIAQAAHEQPEWESALAIIHADQGSVNASAYVYDAKAHAPLLIEDDAFFVDLFDFYDATTENEANPWKACLFGVSKQGEFRLRFGHETDQWRITPANIDTLPAELRPSFDAS
ncbi:MAG: hypothetical protein AAF938_04320 [Myxococcota bacterium]